MRIKKIGLKNFISYGNLDFDFIKEANEPASIYIINGINKDASDSDDNSNGSGKSTLVGEAISFNLFGRNLRGSSKKMKLEDAMKFGEGNMINKVEYYINN
jgi:DNA repair exonuclease SbcCD ATPase subunit